MLKWEHHNKPLPSIIRTQSITYLIQAFYDSKVDEDVGLRTIQHMALYQLAITRHATGELLGLKWQDLDWEQKTLHIRRQLKHDSTDGSIFSQLKTHSSARTIVIGTETLSI